MSKKTHSDLSDTEILEENTDVISKKMFESRLKSLILFVESRPKTVYACMVISMIISAIISFMVMSTKKKSPVTNAGSVASLVTSGFSNLASTASALGNILELQTVVNGLLDKDSLTIADSLMLDSALTRMHKIENQMKFLNSTHPKNKIPDEN